MKGRSSTEGYLGEGQMCNRYNMSVWTLGFLSHKQVIHAMVLSPISAKIMSLTVLLTHGPGGRSTPHILHGKKGKQRLCHLTLPGAVSLFLVQNDIRDTERGTVLERLAKIDRSLTRRSHINVCGLCPGCPTREEFGMC